MLGCVARCKQMLWRALARQYDESSRPTCLRYDLLLPFKLSQSGLIRAFSKLHQICKQGIPITVEVPHRSVAAVAIPMKHGNPMTCVYQFPRQWRSNKTISADKQNAHNQSYVELWFAVPKMERMGFSNTKV